MAENSLTWNFIAKDKASQVAKGIGTVFKEVGTGILLSLGERAVEGVIKFGEALIDGVKAADEYQKLARTTAAVIESTGKKAGVSVKDVQGLANTLENLSAVDSELIQNSENVLLTFTNVKNAAGKNNDVFNQGTLAALNMSTALGSDLQGATIQVGKALNDPIKGITALSRVGVSFTDQQKEQIKAMVKSGDTMGAQKLILKELNTEFGGAAKAAGEGLGGALFRLKDTVGDAFRGLGTLLLPVIQKTADWLTLKAIPAVQSFGTEWGPKLIPTIKNAYNFIMALGRFIGEELWPIIDKGIKGVMPYLQRAWETISKAFKDNQGQLSTLNTWFIKIWDFIKAYVLPILGKLIGEGINVLAQVFGVLITVIGTVISILGKVFSAFGTTVTAVKGVISVGREFITGFADSIKSGYNTVTNSISGFIQSIKNLFGSARTWLLQAGRDVLNGFLDGLKAIWGTVTNWVGGIATWIKDHKGPIRLDRTLLVPAGKAIMQGFLSGLESGAGKAWDFVKSVGGKTKEAIAEALGWIQGIGWAGAGGAVSQSVAQWANTAREALIAAGAPVSWLPSLLARMQRESGGNPNAINLWDINAKNGVPSKGLMQVIGPTFSAYAGQYASRGIYDPFANIYAAIRYTVARYGSGPAGWGQPGGYDRGGMLNPGYTLAYNGTGANEHILTGDQFNTLVGNGGGDTMVNVYLDGELIRGVARVEVQRGLTTVARNISGRRSY